MACLGFRAAGQVHSAKQDVAQLFGRTDIEALASQFVNFILEGGSLLRQLARQTRQDLSVDGNAALFHISQNRHQGPFQPLIDAGQPDGGKPWFQHQPETQRDIGVFCGICGGLVDIDEIEGDKRFAGASDLLIGDRRMSSHRSDRLSMPCAPTPASST